MAFPPEAAQVADFAASDPPGTGRLVNLSTSTPSLGSTLLLNHIITPSVLVRSAVQCSCAVPGVMRAGALLAKSADGAIVPFESAGVMFRDGSMQNDIPLRELASQFHATHFVVSQSQHGQSGLPGKGMSGHKKGMSGHHGLLRLPSKARGCSTHSGGGAWHLRPPQEAMALPPEAAQVDVFAVFDHPGSATRTSSPF